MRPVLRAAALLTALACSAAPAVAGSLFEPAVGPLSAPKGSPMPKGAVLSERIVALDADELSRQILPEGSLEAVDRARRSAGLGGSVTLDLADGVSVAVRRTAVEAAPDGGIVWTGENPDGSFTVLAVDGAGVTGFVQAGTRQYTIDPVGTGGLHRIRQIDQGAMPVDRHIDPPKGKKRHGQAGAPRARTTVTLLAAYTKRSKTVIGSPPAAMAVEVALMNRAMTKSGVPVTIRLLRTVALSPTYDESRLPDPVQPLKDATYGTQATMKTLRRLRDTLKADLVALYADESAYCGVAWQNTDLDPNYGFGVVAASCARSLVLSHELGHTMGLFHDRYVEAAAPNSVYNYGYVSVEGRFTDIMGYPDKCRDAGVTCAWSGFYSSPLRRFNGQFTGIAQNRPGAADGARWLREKRGIAAAFR